MLQQYLPLAVLKRSNRYLCFMREAHRCNSTYRLRY